MALRTVHVGNLATCVTEESLFEFMSQLGSIRAVRLAGRPTIAEGGYPARFAFVEFEDPMVAAHACTISGTKFYERPIKVTKAKSELSAVSNNCSVDNFGMNPRTSNRAAPPELIYRTVYVSGIDAKVCI
eukprot:TRINITY_DN408_c0_g2_i3.p1 TRINITY_DN408_c0_g2~~TRINITY_DN408_c0_g2_i3.p1  ORF type:complete len:130 (+),score=56.32 TRINITY_DN408_c0_g2_i3:146-535(+)